MSGHGGGIARRRVRRCLASALRAAAGPLRVAAALAWPGFVTGHVVTFGRPHGPAAGEGGLHVHLLDVDGYGQMLAALAALILTGALFQAGRRVLRNDDWRPVRVAVLAAPIQGLLFALIEVAERGWTFAATLADPSVVAGVAVQLAVAATMVALLTVTVEAVRAVVWLPSGGGALPAPALLLWRAGRVAGFGSAWILRCAAPRAPPFCRG